MCPICKQPMIPAHGHHDHLEDAIDDLCRKRTSLGENWSASIQQISMDLHRELSECKSRFHAFARTNICSNCNSIDGNLKATRRFPHYFSFSVEDIRRLNARSASIGRRSPDDLMNLAKALYLRRKRRFESSLKLALRKANGALVRYGVT